MKALLAAALLGLLAGCASLGLTQPQNLQQQIVYGYAGVTAALNTLASATSQGLVSSSEATQVNTVILQAKSTLDSANSAAAAGSPTATTLLTTATQTLANVSVYLACKQTKGTACQL